MPIYFNPEFAFVPEQFSEEQIASILNKYFADYCEKSLYFGFQPLSEDLKNRYHFIEVEQNIDNSTRLSLQYGYETTDSIITLGLRQSRFAALLFWEIFHLLKPGGRWLDIDVSEYCLGTALTSLDFLDRKYYKSVLERRIDCSYAKLCVSLFQKKSTAFISGDLAKSGWSFGILTAGQSENAQQMVRTILDLPGPRREVIICGPKQNNLPDDPRIITIDLEQPEPRGWITRKKNLIVDASRYVNLCLMHDRFVFPADFFSVMDSYGSDFAFATFPEAYYPHRDRSCSLRYADYQVLLQQEQLQESIDTRIFQQDNVYYPSYDDFHETAFCCGGIYIAKKSLWNMVRQDEALFHSESEDLLFGLQSQQLGIPHRIIKCCLFESLTPHPIALMSIPVLSVTGEKRHGVPVVSAIQRRLASQNPWGCKPIIGHTRGSYYRRVAEHLNTIPQLPEDCHLDEEDYDSCRKLSDFWQIVYQRLKNIPVSCRDDIARIYYFFCLSVFSWPNGVVQTWVRNTELNLSRCSIMTDDKKLIGWGTGGLYRSLAKNNPVKLAYLIDSNPGIWGLQLDSLQIRAPESLLCEDPDKTIVIVYSSFIEEISQQIEQLGPFNYCNATSFFAGNEYFPILNHIEYYRQIENNYPMIFIDSVPEHTASDPEVTT
ncbi:MAG: hypothetical protein JXR80_09005 [Deltaproteobacteria bacterium]|nr:hypothetical protein [Deltaproteobacteria bacterium]